MDIMTWCINYSMGCKYRIAVPGKFDNCALREDGGMCDINNCFKVKTDEKSETVTEELKCNSIW